MSESRLKRWWRLDEAEERATADNPLEPLGRDQRRPGGPPLALDVLPALLGLFASLTLYLVCRLLELRVMAARRLAREGVL